MTSPSLDPALDSAQRLLQGYSLLEWPDLSATRSPSDGIYTAHSQLAPTRPDRVASIILAISHILGTYCGASDVLLAIKSADTESFNFVRVSWKDSDTYDDVVRAIGIQLAQTASLITLPVVRRVLDLNEKQWPCIALIRFSDGPVPPHGSPLTFTYDASENSISLSSSAKYLHDSVSNQILSQVSLSIAHSEAHPSTPVAYKNLPTELMSVYDRAKTEVDLALAYDHTSHLPFATDYLKRRSVTHPNSIAVRWYPDLSPETPTHGFESISYLQFHQKANQTARWLRRTGLTSEDRVALCMPRNIHYHIAMIGIMRAGGCYVPIDPDLPTERKSYIAQDSDARFVFTSTEVSSPALFGARTVFFEANDIQSAIQDESSDDVDFASPDGLAFLLYTSGTTGNPKGCLCTNTGLAQAIIALSNTAADVRMDDLSQGRYLAVASVAFDVHLAESFTPIVLGMPLLSAPRSQLLENLPFYVKRLGITHLGIVPSLIEATMGAVQEEDGGNGMALRFIGSGGEKMSDAILDKWGNHPKVRLANFYGPSEVTIGCCSRFMETATPRANIGHPFANVSAYVIDTDLNILPRGGIGELVVEGSLVGRGYHARPDLTERVFIEWPKKGDWSYRTGDLVRMMPDQTLEILGRIDSQIKLRGVRIESEGISSIIRKAAPTSSHFSLDVTTVLAKHPSIGTEQLVSFISWDPSVPVSTRKSLKPQVISPPKGLMKRISSICEVELARYMRPSHVIPLGWLPLSSNGKSDAKVLVGIFNALGVEALSELMASTHEQGETRPVTKLEENIFGVLGRHATIPLSVPLPGLNIFECGLDSMAVIRFSKDLKDTFGHRVSASDIMLTPTLSGISSLLSGPSPSPAATVSTSHSADFSSKWSGEIGSNYDLSTVDHLLPPFSVQEGVLSRSADNDGMYVQHVIVSCKSGVRVPDLQRAWRAVMDRHPILRTVFHFSSALVQVVLRPNHLELPWAEDHTDIEDSHEFVRWFLNDRAPDIARNINTTLSNTPPFRLHAYTSPAQTFLALSIHHATYDGISLPLLIDDAEREYLGSAPRGVAMASDILDHMASTDLVKAREFWVDHFHGFSWPHLPRTVGASRTVHRTSAFRSSLSSVKELAASQQVTLQAVLTTAFAIVAATNIYKTSDVSFGVIRSGRLLPVDHVENAICPMVSVIPTRVNFNSSGDVLKNVQFGASAMVDVEHVSLGKVQNWIRPGKPLFDLLFSVSIKADIASEIWDVAESQPPEADYALSVEIVLDPSHDSMLIQAAWKEGELADDLVHGLIGSFEAIALDVGTGKLTDHVTGDHIPVGGAPASKEPVDEVDGESEYTSDPTLLLELQGVVSGFLDINQRLLTETTSFISLGLDSIKSVGLSRVLKKLGHHITAVELMKYCSLRTLTNRLASRGSSLNDVDDQAYSRALTDIRTSFAGIDLKLSPTDVVELFPTTTLQAGMLSQTLSSKGALYVHAFPLRISSGATIDRLRDAWLQTISTFDILRTSFHFHSERGIWAQAVHSINSTQWTSDTFTTSNDYSSKLSAYLASISPKDESSFQSPPIWLRVFEPSPDSEEKTYRFVLVMHHAVYDGVSIGLLFDAVHAIYGGSGVESPIQFTSLLGHLAHQEEVGATFWTRVLEGFQPAYLPSKAHGEETGTAYSTSRTFASDSSLLENILQRSAVTVQCLTQAVWAKLLGELLGTPDVVFGHNVSGRSIPGAEDVIGPVLNTIPCRIRLEDGLRNIDLLRSIHKSNVDALAWQHASLRSIQRKLGISRLWDSLFVFQPIESHERSVDPLWTFDAQEEEATSIQYAITIEVHQLKAGFTLKAACKPGYLDIAELEALLVRFEHVLGHLMIQLDAQALDDVPSLRSVDLKPTTSRGDEERHGERIPEHILSLLVSITDIPASQLTPTTPLVTVGIDSITAIQIVTHFRRAGLVLTANDIITSRTVGDMVAKIQPSDSAALTDAVSAQLAPEISDDEKTAILARFDNPDIIENISPTSSGMKWLIGSWQSSAGTAFHHSFAYYLPNDVDLPRLRAAWTSLQERLFLTRSTFACAKGSREPRIVTFKLGSYTDSWKEEKTEGVLSDWVMAKGTELVTSPPSLSLPPTRATFCQSPERSCIIIYFHHFQFDAWSVPLIMDDLSRLYLGLEPVTTNNTSTFLQVSGPTPDNLAAQKRYWQKTFPQKFAPVLLPSLMLLSPPTFDRTIYTTKSAVFGAALCEERARTLQVSLSSVFLGCWAQVQGRYSSSDAITLGLWQAGRSGLLDKIAGLASPCSNIVPMLIPATHANGAIGIAQAIQDDLRERSAAVLQSDLVKIDEWIDAGGKPLCNVVVNVIRLAPASSGAKVLEQIELPYFIPPPAPADPHPVVDRLATTDLVQVRSHENAVQITTNEVVQNDLILDFAVLPEDDTILMSIDAGAHIMDEIKAIEVVEQWARAVREALSIP
ncbi:NRPS protein [Asterophora parasitica]|uniref:NRPS protein n=1 Tax=Asterophora parasitica TaxID=117018 RepID=A0A9P7KB27_9AGAR|nr:NRPS protein [Asterophora parasitica]